MAYFAMEQYYDTLKHFGIPGMKWGIRRQRKPAGKKSRFARAMRNTWNATKRVAVPAMIVGGVVGGTIGASKYIANRKMAALKAPPSFNAMRNPNAYGAAYGIDALAKARPDLANNPNSDLAKALAAQERLRKVFSKRG